MPSSIKKGASSFLERRLCLEVGQRTELLQDEGEDGLGAMQGGWGSRGDEG